MPCSTGWPQTQILQPLPSKCQDYIMSCQIQHLDAFIPWLHNDPIVNSVPIPFLLYFKGDTDVLCGDILLACISAYHTCVWCSPRPEKGTGSPGTWVTDGCMSACGCWVIEPGSSARTVGARSQLLSHLSSLPSPFILIFSQVSHTQHWYL